jgi:hypothetical protein
MNDNENPGMLEIDEDGTITNTISDELIAKFIDDIDVQDLEGMFEDISSEESALDPDVMERAINTALTSVKKQLLGILIKARVTEFLTVEVEAGHNGLYLRSMWMYDHNLGILSSEVLSFVRAIPYSLIFESLKVEATSISEDLGSEELTTLRSFLIDALSHIDKLMGG